MSKVADKQQSAPESHTQSGTALMNALMRTAANLDVLQGRISKRGGIPCAQLNALQILAEFPEGLSRNDLGKRLINPEADVTRLLDRMEEAGLVVRERTNKDRRVVLTRITLKGLEAVKEIDPQLEKEMNELFSTLSEDETQSLLAVLSKIRSMASD